MERIKVQMDDPIFAPGVAKAPKVPITVSPSGLACEAELFLGPNETTKSATSGRKAFTSTGASQLVNCPITMPTPPVGSGQSYRVYIDVYAGGYRILAGIGTEDVIIPGGSIGPIDWGV